MGLLGKIFNKQKEVFTADLSYLQSKFNNFLHLLESNHHALKVMSDMEEKSLGEYVFDINYIRTSLDEIRDNISSIIDNLVILGGDKYDKLFERYMRIDDEIASLLSNKRTIAEDELTIPLEKLNQAMVHRVGSKNAQLGEINSLPGVTIPNGFAITVWAYKRFIDSNDLQNRINKRISSVDIKDFSQLVTISDEIQEIVYSSVVPDDVRSAILKSYKKLNQVNISGLVSVRSSALGEDTGLSFAGQYATFLGVKEDDVLNKYKRVIASKFTPKAIFYFLSHSLEESELAMGVGCVEMIFARSSGVIYTRNPVRPKEDYMIVNSIFGLGKLLVDGEINPDIFIVKRNDTSEIENIPSRKECRLVLQKDGEIVKEKLPPELMDELSLRETEIIGLVTIANKIEKHYGFPLDIEWAINNSGKVVVMQVRPLKIIESAPEPTVQQMRGLTKINEGATTVCPGAEAGKICHISSPDHLGKIPEGSVLVAPRPFPGLITAMDSAAALVTKFGGIASHMATIAREYRLPTISGVEDISILKEGMMVTVDATHGIIYEGANSDFIEARMLEREILDESSVLNALNSILKKISPLNLLHPSSPEFMIENCKTLHDITRFAHQKAMEEMFKGFYNIHSDTKAYLQLKTEIPLEVDIIYLDREVMLSKGMNWVDENNIGSLPMESFWNGVRLEGWPSGPKPDVNKRLKSISSNTRSDDSNQDFSMRSFAILTKEFMILSLKMGYHFSTIEAMCTNEPSKNYVKMLFKDGGANLDRRSRRIRLMMDILSLIGFENTGHADFMESRITYESHEQIINHLKILGRLSMLTKQLDMALSNDSIANWYTKDFIKRLDLEKQLVSQ